MRVGIAIDDWKLPTFERRLSDAGYSYEKGAGVTDDTRMLYVETDKPVALEVVIRAANDECARQKL